MLLRTRDFKNITRGLVGLRFHARPRRRGRGDVFILRFQNPRNKDNAKRRARVGKAGGEMRASDKGVRLVISKHP